MNSVPAVLKDFGSHITFSVYFMLSRDFAINTMRERFLLQNYFGKSVTGALYPGKCAKSIKTVEVFVDKFPESNPGISPSFCEQVAFPPLRILFILLCFLHNCRKRSL